MDKLISIIVPAYNEEKNIKPLISAVDSMTKESSLTCELIIVDDGSTDRTYDVASELIEGKEEIKLIRHNRNQGKTEAILSGLDISSGEYIAILDADLQYSPSDIPIMVEKLSDGYDMVTGWKEGRYKKQFTSSIYNWLSRALFRIPIHDQNSIKVIRREVLEVLSLRKDWHRYIVALAVERGYKVTEIKVKLYPRRFGEEKYRGKGRIIIGVLDLIAVKFQVSFMRKPMLFFGTAGGVFLSLGVIVGLYALYMRFVLERGFRPLLSLIILLIVVGILLFMLGFTAEILSAIVERIERLEKRGEI